MSWLLYLILLNFFSFGISYDDDYYELPFNGKSLKIVLNKSLFVKFKLNLQKKVWVGTKVSVYLLEEGICDNIIMKSDYSYLECKRDKNKHLVNSFIVKTEDLEIIKFSLDLNKLGVELGHMIILYCKFGSSDISQKIFTIILVIFFIFFLGFFFLIVVQIKENRMNKFKKEFKFKLLNKKEQQDKIKSELDENELCQKELNIFSDIKQKIGFEQVNLSEKEKWFRFSYLFSIIITLISLFFFLWFFINKYEYDHLRRYICLELFFFFYLISITFNLLFLDFYDICNMNLKIVGYEEFCDFFRSFSNSNYIKSSEDNIKEIYNIGGTFILPESKEILIKLKRTIKIYDIPNRRENMFYYNNIFNNKEYNYILLTKERLYSKFNIYSILCLLTLTGIIYDWYKKKNYIYYQLKQLYILKEKLSEENEKLLNKLRPAIYYNKEIKYFCNKIYEFYDIKKYINNIDIYKIDSFKEIKEESKLNETKIETKTESEQEFSKVYDLWEVTFHIIIFYWKNKKQFNIRVRYDYQLLVDDWVNEDKNQLEDGRKSHLVNGPEDQTVVDYVKYFPYPIQIFFNDLTKESHIYIPNIIRC